MGTPVAEGCEIRFNQPDFLYRKHDNISQSELKEVLRSPAHYLARYGPDADPNFPSIAMMIGTALHAKVLEPEAFGGMFYDRAEKPKDLTVAEIRQALDEEGIEYKKTSKKPELESLLYPDGKPVDKRTSLSTEDFKIVCGMADALRTHDVAGTWFDPGRTNYRRANELSIYIDEDHSGLGLPIKGRIDRLEKTSTGWVILDLKSTDDASPDAFMKKAYNLNYHLQSAYYTNLLARAFNTDQVSFIFCAVERKRPHGIQLYKASDEMLNFGHKKMMQSATTLRDCIASDTWPGYESDIRSIGLPGWAK